MKRRGKASNIGYVDMEQILPQKDFNRVCPKCGRLLLKTNCKIALSNGTHFTKPVHACINCLCLFMPEDNYHTLQKSPLKGAVSPDVAVYSEVTIQKRIAKHFKCIPPQEKDKLVLLGELALREPSRPNEPVKARRERVSSTLRQTSRGNASAPKYLYPSCSEHAVLEGYCWFHYAEEHYTNR